MKTLFAAVSTLLVMSLMSCGVGSGPGEEFPLPISVMPDEATTRPSTSQRLELVGTPQHPATSTLAADTLTLRLVGCRGSLQASIDAATLQFCAAGNAFRSIHDVPTAVENCVPSSTFSAGGNNGIDVRGNGYLVLRGTEIIGRLRIADHTDVPSFWDGGETPFTATLEFLSATP